MKKPLRTVFISSTVKDLARVRTQVKKFLESQKGPVKIRCLVSECPDFPVDPRSLVNAGTYEVCLANIRRSDFVIQIIGDRYGVRDIRSKSGLISITHAEYREGEVFGVRHE